MVNKVAVLGTFESQGRCTNWRGYSQALNARFSKVKYYDLINRNEKEITESMIAFNPDIIFCLLPAGLGIAGKVKVKCGCINILHYMDYNLKWKKLPIKNKDIDYMFLSNKNQIDRKSVV